MDKESDFLVWVTPNRESHKEKSLLDECHEIRLAIYAALNQPTMSGYFAPMPSRVSPSPDYYVEEVFGNYAIVSAYIPGESENHYWKVLFHREDSGKVVIDGALIPVEKVYRAVGELPAGEPAYLDDVMLDTLIRTSEIDAGIPIEDIPIKKIHKQKTSRDDS